LFDVCPARYERDYDDSSCDCRLNSVRRLVGTERRSFAWPGPTVCRGGRKAWRSPCPLPLSAESIIEADGGVLQEGEARRSGGCGHRALSCGRTDRGIKDKAPGLDGAQLQSIWLALCWLNSSNLISLSSDGGINVPIFTHTLCISGICHFTGGPQSPGKSLYPSHKRLAWAKVSPLRRASI
jgi:hypothetical protein